MNKKAVFFDADGTVCDIEKGVPDSAVRAITQRLFRDIWNRSLLPE